MISALMDNLGDSNDGVWSDNSIRYLRRVQHVQLRGLIGLASKGEPIVLFRFE
jgi:hypothetical protein